MLFQNYFIMSFGRQQYQHRFFKEVPLHKKMIDNSSNLNNVLPQIFHPRTPSPPVAPPQNKSILVNLVNPNPQLNLGSSDLNNIVVEAINPQIQQYKSNMTMLEYFKREAEERKRRKMFPHLRNQEISRKYNTIKTQGSQPLSHQQSRMRLQSVNVAYNPQQLRQSVHKAEIQSLIRRNKLQQQQRAFILSKLEEQNLQSNMRMRSIQKKYSKLKKKLNQELLEKKRQTKLQSIVRQELIAKQQKDQLMEIKGMMSEISGSLQKNSQILEESIRIREQLNQKKEKKYISTEPSQKNNSSVQMKTQSLEETYTSEEQSVRPPPSVVYTKKSLDSQYNQMQKLRSDIHRLNFRIKKVRD